MTLINTTRVATGMICAALATLLLTAHVHAQPPFRGPGGGPRGEGQDMRLLEQLDLTEAQREQVQEISERNREASRALNEQIRTARTALNEAVMADVVNESQIRAAAAGIAPLEADAAVQRAYARAELLAVLTPDQRAELETLRAEMRERMQERLRGRRAGQ